MKYLFENINNYNIDDLYAHVSKARIDKTTKLKNPEVKLRSLAVEYLLNRLLMQEYPKISTPVDITYDEHGKPHLFLPDSPDEEKIFISLSHSGDYAAVMVSDKPCGIDIEKHGKRDYIKIAKRVCTEKELSLISDVQSFYNIWTLKEASLKACGLGLSYDMRLIETSDIEINGIKYAGTVLKAPAGYSLSCCEAI